LAKGHREKGQFWPNVVPWRDNLTDKKWHDLVIQSYWRPAPMAVVSLYRIQMFISFIPSL
jgi:hypothetical protein